MTVGNKLIAIVMRCLGMTAAWYIGAACGRLVRRAEIAPGSALTTLAS